MAVIGWWAEAFIIPSGMATTGGFGTPQVGVLSGEPQTITLTGISSGETFGVCTVTVGAIIVSPAGIVSGEEFGAPGVTVGPVTVTPAGVASGEAFGTVTITVDQHMSPTGIASAEAFGTADVQTTSGVPYTVPFTI